MGGKTDWLGYGLPYEGDADLVVNHLLPPPTCSLDDDVPGVRSQLASDDDVCVVLGPERLVAGVLAGGDLEATGPAHAVMDHSVSTVRPSQETADLVHRMHGHDLSWMVVTDPGGRLVGLFRPSRVPAQPDG